MNPNEDPDLIVWPETLPPHRAAWVRREIATATKTESVLRDYQIATVVGCRDAVMNGENPVAWLPTGAGKTHVGVSIVHGANDRGNRVLWLAHRRELTKQASERMDVFGVSHTRLEAGFAFDAHSDVAVASVQTVSARLKNPAVLAWLADVDVVIVDEAHRVRAAQHANVVRACGKAVVVGLTATPLRLDGKGLGDVFDRIVNPISAEELIDGGFLMEPEYFSPSQPDFSGVRKMGGEYDRKATSAIMGESKIVGGIVKNIVENEKNRRGVIFASSISNSLDLVARLNEAGIDAAHIDGTTPTDEREDVLDALFAGDLQVVSNVNILTEGWDLPDLGWAADCSPTLSWSRFMQRVGRIMRPADGKARPTLYDHAGNLGRHGFPTDRVVISLDDSPSKKADSPKAKVCRYCHAANPVHATTCCACGMPFPKREQTGPEVVEGELKNVKTKRPTAAAKAAFYEKHLKVAQACGHKRGYATHRYKSEFGVMPRGAWFRPLVTKYERSCDHVQVENDVCRFCLRHRSEFE